MSRHCAKGNYILTKYMKLCERFKSRASFSNTIIMNEYELLQNMKVKQRQRNHHSSTHSQQLTRLTRRLSESDQSQTVDLTGKAKDYETFK